MLAPQGKPDYQQAQNGSRALQMWVRFGAKRHFVAPHRFGRCRRQSWHRAMGQRNWPEADIGPL